MIKPLFKILSFSFVTLASAALVSAAQAPATDRATGSESARFGCLTQADIDQGWEKQLAQLEKRLAEKEAEGLAVPGAIITPPFEAFAPYRTDVPATVTASKAPKSSRHGGSRSSRY